MDPMYVDALPSAVQAANPQTTLSAQHSATPGQITALRLEMQNALDKMESELKLKDELLNVLRQNGSMKDVQIKQKDDDIKLKDAEIKQKDDEVRQRDQEIKQGHDKIKVSQNPKLYGEIPTSGLVDPPAAISQF
jgi:phage tail tube protein FII